MIATPHTVAATITPIPCRWTRRVHPLVAAKHERTHRRRRVEQAEDARTAEVLRDGREQRHRHAEQHRDDVHHVGADQLGAAPCVAEALEHSREARASRRRRAAAPPASAAGRRGPTTKVADIDQVGDRAGRRPRPARRRAPARRSCRPCRAGCPSAPAAFSSSRSTRRGRRASSEGR